MASQAHTIDDCVSGDWADAIDASGFDDSLDDELAMIPMELFDRPPCVVTPRSPSLPADDMGARPAADIELDTRPFVGFILGDVASSSESEESSKADDDDDDDNALFSNDNASFSFNAHDNVDEVEEVDCCVAGCVDSSGVIPDDADAGCVDASGVEFNDYYLSSDDEDDDDHDDDNDDSPHTGPSNSLFSSEKDAKPPKGTVFFRGLGYSLKNPNKKYLQYQCSHRRSRNPVCCGYMHVPRNADGGFGVPYEVGQHHKDCDENAGINYEEYIASGRGCHGKKPPPATATATAAAGNVVELNVLESMKKRKESTEPV